MTSPSQADALARESALAVEHSVLLQAPAGSGKTEVLTQRFLSLLGVVDEPEEILAITFTRKAAAEMRRRIVAILDGPVDPSRPTAAKLEALRSRALLQADRRGWDRVELRSRLRIQTIDSLNHELARSMPLLGHGGASLTVVDDADALYRAAARRALSEVEAGDDADLQQALDLLLRRLDNQTARAEALLTSLLARRAQWLPAIAQHDPEALARTVQRSLESLAAVAIRKVSTRLSAGDRATATRLLRHAAVTLADAYPEATRSVWLDPRTALDDSSDALEAWRTLANLLLTKTGGWRKSIDARLGFPTKPAEPKDALKKLIEAIQDTPGLQAALATITELPPPQLGVEESDALAALARLLRHAAASLQHVFSIEGRVDHTAIAGFARQGLGGPETPTDLALRRASALKHLLVDEFQDTSVEQLHLLEQLTLGWTPGDGRSLFIVGDPMQSIYQFRSAEVGLFLRARESGIGDLPLRSANLTRNFRSSPPVIDWCNQAFRKVFPPEDDVRESAVAFLPAEPGRGDASAPDGEAVSVTVTPLPDADAANEAERVAQAAVDARARRPDCSLAVLVQTGTVAPPVIAALRRRGFDVRGVDLEPMARRPAIRDIVALGCALLHPCDRIAWLAVLRAPHVGLSLADLLELCDGASAAQPVLELLRTPQCTARVGEDGRARLERCVPVLEAAVDDRARGRFVPALRATWEKLGGPAALRDDDEWRQVESWLAAVQRREAEGARLDGALLRDLAEKLRLGAQTARTDSVEVLTIHRAKGLEWDVVLLPGLHRATRGDERPLLAWIELPRPDRDVDLLLAALTIGRNAKHDRLGAYIARLRQRRIAHERCRLAYVAATRARHELHLFGHAPPDKEGVPRPRGQTMLRTLWPAVVDVFATHASVAAEEGEVTLAAPPPTPALWRLPADWRAPTDVEAPSLPRLSGSPEADDEPPPEFVWVGREARAIGTLVHAEFERAAREGGLVETVAPARRVGWSQRLRELGVPSARLGAATERIARVLAGLHEDAQVRWILSNAHRDASSELRLSGIVDGELRDIVIDRTFVDERGDRWIVDYKTGSHQGGDLEAFVAQEVERYAPQLMLYRRLVAELGPEPVRVALYFPLLRRFVEVVA